MGKYFDDAHALWGSQLLGQPVEVTDSEDVAAARKKASDYESCMVLGKALSRQLRYREASEAFGRALQNTRHGRAGSGIPPGSLRLF